MKKLQLAKDLTQIERNRQIHKEGYTADHDNNHNEGELGIAALCYQHDPYERDLPGGDIDLKTALPNNWPFEEEYWKPSPNDRKKELVKAGSLYRAEIERLKGQLDSVHIALVKLL